VKKIYLLLLSFSLFAQVSTTGGGGQPTSGQPDDHIDAYITKCSDINKKLLKQINLYIYNYDLNIKNIKQFNQHLKELNAKNTIRSLIEINLKTSSPQKKGCNCDDKKKVHFDMIYMEIRSLFIYNCQPSNDVKELKSILKNILGKKPYEW
jgi:hypothetical protein